MIQYQALIEDSTGNVLASGFQDLTQNAEYDAGLHSIRTDCPYPCIPKKSNNSEYHNFNGSTYDLIDQSTVVDLYLTYQSREGFKKIFLNELIFSMAELSYTKTQINNVLTTLVTVLELLDQRLIESAGTVLSGVVVTTDFTTGLKTQMATFISDYLANE